MADVVELENPSRRPAGSPPSMVGEHEGRWANAAKSDESRIRESTLGQTDFGKVDPESLPGLLPQAGPTRLVYDAEMRLTKVRDVLENVRVIDYDAMGRVESRSWPFKSGNPIEHAFLYDKHGNLTSFTDGEGAVTTYGYDGYDRQVEETAPGAHGSDPGAAAQARITRLRYDHNDNLRFTETPRGVETANDADDFTWETGFDSLDRVIFEEAPDGGRDSYTYDVASNMLTETRPRGQGLSGEALESFQTRMTYDDADRLIESLQQVDDGGTLDELVTTLGYDADDNLTLISEPGAKFDPSQSSPSPQLTQMVYDGRGLPWKTKVGGTSAERTSLVEYDPNGNLRRLVNPRGINPSTDEQLVVDDGTASNDNLRDASENATVLRYDAHDLVIAERMPWDADDDHKFRRLFKRADNDEGTDNRLRRLISLVSPHEVTDEGTDVGDPVARTSYRYLESDWIKSISDQKLGIDPSSNQRVVSRLVEYDYDERGTQLKWESKNAGETAAGRHITRTFWPSGQLKSRTAKKTSEQGEEPSVRRYQYLYNRNGSLTGFVDLRNPDPDEDEDDRLTSIARDPVERQSAVNETWTNGRDTRQTFDLADNVRTRETDGKIQPGGGFTGDDVKTTTFDYDSLDRETQMTVDPAIGATRVTTTNYWPSGRRESRNKPNGVVERWFFTTRGEVSRLSRDDENGPDALTIYAYDANGNRDRDERGRYEFNARDQLTLWEKPGSADQPDDPSTYDGQLTRYELNADGAITEKSVQSGGQPPVVTTFTYRGERLLWAGDDQVRAFYRYDDFGNVVSVRQHAQVNGQFPQVDDDAPQSSDCAEVPQNVANDETYYCYDEFERLRLSKGAGISQSELLEYDGLDRRDARIERQASTSVRRDLSYVGTSELLSRETDEGGEKRFYDYDSVGDRQGQQVTDGTSNRYRSYRKDANGSVLALEDDNGEVPTGERYGYDPYGELETATSDAEAVANPFRFQGFYYDSGVKTYDTHARAYRPEHGRFLSQDRYASASQDLLMQADGLTQNRYAFAGANPVNNVEFDGHKSSVPGGGGAHGKVKDLRPGAKPRRNKQGVPTYRESDYIEYREEALSSPSGATPSLSMRAIAERAHQYTQWEPLRPIMNQLGCHHNPNAICSERPPSSDCPNNAVGAICDVVKDTVESIKNPGSVAEGFWYELTHTGTLGRMIDQSCKDKRADYCGTSLLSSFVTLKGFGTLRGAAKEGRHADDVEDDFIVVRGGESDVPPPGEVFSGAAGHTVEEAASGVPHGKIRSTTARAIREAGGTVRHAPELSRSGILNELHVNICLGRGRCPFGELFPNPVPKSGRIR